MQLHQLKPIHKRKSKKRVGRGGKRGSYSGRGMGGQGKRAGRKLQPIIRSLIKRYPKWRGYRFSSSSPKPAAVNLDQLEKNFQDNEKIIPQALLAKKIIRKKAGREPAVKILGRGELKKKLVIEGCQISEGAKEKIEKAGGIIIKS